MPRKIEIQWMKMPHINAEYDEETKMLGIQVKPTDQPLPRVTVITKLTDLVGFQFALYSWYNFVYPKELLNWIILDSQKLMSHYDKEKLCEDSRVRVITTKKKYHDLIAHALNLEWSGDQSLERPNYAMLLDCGDVMMPDTLSIKFRALQETDCDCALPNSLAYYNPGDNTSKVYKYYMALPSSGLYFKKTWWRTRNTAHAVGIPYIANCVSIGAPKLLARYMPSSSRFFDGFPPEVKELIKTIVNVANGLRDSKS